MRDTFLLLKYRSYLVYAQPKKKKKKLVTETFCDNIGRCEDITDNIKNQFRWFVNGNYNQPVVSEVKPASVEGCFSTETTEQSLLLLKYSF